MSRHHRSVNRREFMTGVAATAAAFPFVFTSLARGEGKQANERLTLGFIGVGMMNRGHLGHFLGQKDVQVVAVCDVDTKRRDDAKKRVEEKYAEETRSGQYKGCAAYNDFNELIARKDIDAVVIATPDHWHTIPCLEAIKAGKDIYCEKPLTLTIHEAKTLIDAVRKYDRVFQVGSQQRSENTFRTACELVRNGRIGKLKTVYVRIGGPSKPCDLPEEPMEEGLDWERWLGPAPKRPYNSILSPRGIHNHFPNWRLYREYSGGMMTDWGAHHFDIAQWGLDMDQSGPVEIVPPADPKAERGVKYIYANGVEVIHADTIPGLDPEKAKKMRGVTFVGTDGIVFVDRGYIASDPEDLHKQPIGEGEIHLYKSPGHQRDWLNCVRSRKRPICDVEVGARSVTVCHLGNLAYWNHKKLRWDPEHWQFVGDSEANKWLDRERRDPYQLPKV